MAYAVKQDIVNVGFPATGFGSITDAQVSAILQDVSDRMDGYFRGRWGMTAVPLVAWDSTVRGMCARIGAFEVACVRGFNAANRADVQLKDREREAWEWCDKVQRQQIHPLVTLANANAPGAVQPNLVSSSVVNLSSGGTARNRGW